jgi:hypothetical protein
MNDSDAVIGDVGHIYTPVAIHRNTVRVVELRCSAGSIRVARDPSSSQGGYHPVGINTPYPVPIALSKIDVPLTVSSYAAFRPAKVGLGARTVTVISVAITRQSRDHDPLHVEIRELASGRFVGR